MNANYIYDIDQDREAFAAAVQAGIQEDEEHQAGQEG